MRGEQRPPYALAPKQAGSPPLARGTGPLRPSSKPSAGITPACAGNSRRLGISPRRARDHPRLRGEQHTRCPIARRGMGSPPLARGTVKILATRYGVAGITPACAGNSQSIKFCAYSYRDHPRLRGEQTKKRLVVPCILQYCFSFFNQFFVDMFC